MNMNESESGSKEPLPSVPSPAGKKTDTEGVDVNSGVDGEWDLVQYSALSRFEGPVGFKIRVLGRKGREAEVMKFLDFLSSDPGSLGSLMAKVRGILNSPREDHWRFYRPGRGQGDGVYEIKAKTKKYRLFFFYGDDAEGRRTLLICTHGFIKTKPSQEEQEREFAKAARIRSKFLAQRRRQ